MNARLFATMQYLLPKHGLSRLMHALARSQRPGLKKATIDVFLKNFRVDMQEAVESNPYAYESFNAFFTRALKPSARPIAPDADALVSPVDGTISQIGMIDDDAIIQAKGHQYSLLALLAGDAQLAQRYRGGHFACIYLAPYNYHRIHMPLTGILNNTIYVPGDLFSVNTATAQQVPDLFARNERVICDFQSSQTCFAMAFIGALFVGSIETVWAGEINPVPRSNRIVQLEQGRGRQFNKGEEAGRFNMGSTVILLIERDRMEWSSTLQAGSAVKLGQRIGTLKVP
ncbi:MAG: archaetidylserine decarboxylase [Steroidobacter sp.]